MFYLPVKQVIKKSCGLNNTMTTIPEIISQMLYVKDFKVLLYCTYLRFPVKLVEIVIQLSYCRV